MKLIDWNDSIHSVGIAKIDDEHRQLVDLINAVESKKDADSDFLNRLINTLIFCAQNHFAHEEKLMKRIHYPNYEAHHQQHQRFVKTIANLEKNFREGVMQQEIRAKLGSFLMDWLVNHILVEDRSYSQYLTDWS